MKKQTLKKITALFMAIAVILVALPLSSLTHAVSEVESYAIALNAPAVPMVKNTKVAFSSLQVQFSDGYVNGNALTWSLKNDTTGIRLTSDGIVANQSGAYLVTATKADGVTSTEVVVVVAESADGPFNIFDFDFTNTTAAEVNSVFGCQNYPSGSTTAAVTDSELSATNGITRKSGYALYVKDISIIGKFSDYTVSTVQSFAADAYKTSGVLGRALLTDAGLLDITANKSVAVSVARINGTTSTALLTAGSNKQYVYSTNTALNTAYSFEPAVKANEFQEVSVEFGGNNFKIYLENDSGVLTQVYSLADDTVITSAQKTMRYPSRNSATVGISGTNSTAYNKNLTVSIPVTSMPVATAVVDAYAINTAFPVLPMVKNTQVALENLKVQLADGTYMYGNELNWAESTDYENVAIENGIVTAYATGGYLLNATVPATNEIVEVVVSVAETADGPFNIFEFDFTNTTAAEVNRVFGYQNYPSGTTTATVLDSELSATDGIARKAGYALYVKDISIIGKFSDYTVSTVQKFPAIGYQNSGIMGRSVLTGAGLLDTTNNKSVSVAVARINGVTNTAYLTVGSGNKQYAYSTNTALNTAYNFDPPVKADEFQNVAVEFSGNDFTLYLDNANNVLTKVYSLQEDTVITSAQKNVRYPSRKDATVGLFGINTVVYHKNLTVSIPVDTNNLPFMTSIATSSEITVLKNTVVDLSESFGDVDFADYRDEIGEISGGKFVAYSAGTAYITDTEGEKYSVIVTTEEENVTAAGEKFAPECITVIPNAESPISYTAQVTPGSGKEIKNGVITVVGTAPNGTSFDTQVLMETTDINADKFPFVALYPHLMTLSCDIIDSNVPYITPLGATAHLPIVSANYYGIKFVSRVSVIRADNNSGTTATADTILIDGKEYPVVSAGTILLPTVLIPNGEELTAETDLANVVTTNTVSSVTYKHSDISVKLTGIPESFLGTDITARAFVKYNKGTEQEPVYEYFYGEQMERSYNGVLKAAYPAIDNSNPKVDDILVGGSNYALDGDNTTDDLSYKVGEEITIALGIKGNYYIDSYTVNKDYADGETEAESVTVSGANISKVFKYTTSMEKAGVLTLKLRVFGKINDNLGATNQLVKLVVMSVAVDFDNINNQDYLPNDATVATYLTGIATTWDNSTEMANLSAHFDEIKEFVNSGNASFEVPNVIKLTKTDKSTAAYNVYEYIIATNAARGLETTNSAGYFEYAEFNERPATGYITVPVSGTAAATGGIYAFYMGWSNAASASTNYASSAKICVYPNAHACLNGQSSEYYTNLGSVSNDGYSSSDYKHNAVTGKYDLKDGATKVTVGGKAVYGDYRFMFESDDDAVSADDLFDYGVIKRDYFSLQLAKAIAPEGSTIENYGGSMGGWQSVVLAAIESDVKKLTAVMPWKCTLGSDKVSGMHINSTFMPTYSSIRMNYNTVAAAKMLSSDVEVLVPSGLGDETAPVFGAIALYNAANVTNKKITLTQFQTHNGYQTNVLTQSTRTAQ
ncbi:MAG: hypothetical protein IJF35_01290 [Clostridia bacterium]|nr:hypothetical protein [Clostridia bacterium]